MILGYVLKWDTPPKWYFKRDILRIQTPLAQLLTKIRQILEVVKRLLKIWFPCGKPNPAEAHKTVGALLNWVYHYRTNPEKVASNITWMCLPVNCLCMAILQLHIGYTLIYPSYIWICKGYVYLGKFVFYIKISYIQMCMYIHIYICVHCIYII